MDELFKILSVFGIGGAVGGAIGYFIKSFLDFHYTRKSDKADKKQAAYQDLNKNLRIFISGEKATAEMKNKFLETYSTCWLWVPDSVLSKLNDFLEFQIRIANGEKIEQKLLKEKYVSCVIAMRKDLGIKKTLQNSDSYKFVQF